MTCDLLVLAPHPDDAEIHAGGLIAAHVRLGLRVVVVDATRGELGSRGTPAERAVEAAAAAQILGVAVRDNLDLPDGAIDAGDPEARGRVVDALRRHRPRTCVCLSGHARHPDHIALAEVVRGAIKAAALHHYRPTLPAVPDVRLWFVEAEVPLMPTLLVPCQATDWERKLAAIRCYGSQLHRPGSALPATSIASEGFLDWIDARGRTWGHQAGAAYAEALVGPEAARVANLCSI